MNKPREITQIGPGTEFGPDRYDERQRELEEIFNPELMAKRLRNLVVLENRAKELMEEE